MSQQFVKDSNGQDVQIADRLPCQSGMMADEWKVVEEVEYAGQVYQIYACHPHGDHVHRVAMLKSKPPR